MWRDFVTLDLPHQLAHFLKLSVQSPADAPDRLCVSRHGHASSPPPQQRERRRAVALLLTHLSRVDYLPATSGISDLICGVHSPAAPPAPRTLLQAEGELRRFISTSTLPERVPDLWAWTSFLFDRLLVRCSVALQ